MVPVHPGSKINAEIEGLGTVNVAFEPR
jgi:hypothetical protein